MGYLFHFKVLTTKAGQLKTEIEAVPMEVLKKTAINKKEIINHNLYTQKTKHMKNSIKVSVLAIAIACSFAACKSKSSTAAADSLKAADSAKSADSAKLKTDSTKVDSAKVDSAKKDTTKK